MTQKKEVWPVYTHEDVDDYSSVAFVCDTRELAVELAAKVDGTRDSFGGQMHAWASDRPMQLHVSDQKDC